MLLIAGFLQMKSILYIYIYIYKIKSDQYNIIICNHFGQDIMMDFIESHIRK